MNPPGRINVLDGICLLDEIQEDLMNVIVLGFHKIIPDVQFRINLYKVVKVRPVWQ